MRGRKKKKKRGRWPRLGRESDEREGDDGTELEVPFETMRRETVFVLKEKKEKNH